MLATLILAALPAAVMSASFQASPAPDRQVRVAHDGEPAAVSMSVQSDGRVLKVTEEPAAKEDSDKQLEDYEKYLAESRKKAMSGGKDAADQIIDQVKHAAKSEQEKKAQIKEHSPPKADKEAKEDKEALVEKLQEIKEHSVDQKEIMEAIQMDKDVAGSVKPHISVPSAKKQMKLSHDAESKLPEGVALIQMEASAPDESWKSAFFFFASLVLIVVLVGFIISMFYYNREKDAQDGGAEKVGLTQPSTVQAPLNDSSSTSDSGEKIAMLFDRVRKSLEDLSDKTPAEQADMAGGQSQNTL